MHDRVRADRHVRTDVGGRRIHQRHPGFHQRLVLGRSQNCRHVRQLLAAVHSEHFSRISHDHRLDGQSARAIGLDQVGEVILALRVRRPEPAQGREQRLEIERVDAAVDFADLALLRRGVLVLDDGHQLIAAADDPPVARRVLQHGGHHRRGGAALAVARDQGSNGFRPQQRHVSGQQHHRAARAAQVRFRLEQRVAGAELRLLHDEVQSADAAERCSEQLRLMTDDDRQRRGFERRGISNDVPDERQSVRVMNQLRQGGLHPGPLAGGQNDQVQVGHRNSL